MSAPLTLKNGSLKHERSRQIVVQQGRPRAAQILLEFLEAGMKQILLPKIRRGFEQLSCCKDVLAAARRREERTICLLPSSSKTHGILKREDDLSLFGIFSPWALMPQGRRRTVIASVCDLSLFGICFPTFRFLSCRPCPTHGQIVSLHIVHRAQQCTNVHKSAQLCTIVWAHKYAGVR